MVEGKGHKIGRMLWPRQKALEVGWYFYKTTCCKGENDCTGQKALALAKGTLLNNVYDLDHYDYMVEL